MSLSRPARQRLHAARAAACTGDYEPKRYVLTVDDTNARSRYASAAAALGLRRPEDFLLFAAEYTLRHCGRLADTRACIRRVEARMKKERAAERAAGRGKR